MSSDIVAKLEDLRYKYLSAKHDGPPVKIEEMQDDMILLIYAIQVLIDPFKDYSIRKVNEK